MPVGCARPLQRGVAEHHRLHAAEPVAKATPSATSRKGVGPGLLAHRRRHDQEFAGEHAEGGMPRIASEPSISPQATVG
jgi:hypothetical protein